MFKRVVVVLSAVALTAMFFGCGSENPVATSFPPVITQQPVSDTVMSGEQARFFVYTAGTTPSYQWQKDGVPIAGAPNSYEYIITNASASNAGVYSVIVSNAKGTVLSANATLTIFSLPVITLPPAAFPDTVNIGAQVTFAVGAVGDPAITSYEWWKVLNGGASYSWVATTATNSYVINAASLTDAGTYYVVVRNSAGFVPSNTTFTLTVNNPNPNSAPVITIQPVINPNDTVNIGAQVTFTVGAVGTPAITSYEWWKGDGAGGAIRVDSTTTNSYVITAASLADAGTYFVVVKNSVGSVQSDFFTLTVNNPYGSPVITIQPVISPNDTVTVGDAVTFAIGAAGNPAITSYEWWKGDGTGGAIRVDSTTTNSHVIAAASLADAGTYFVVVKNSVGSVQSDVFTLTVINPNPNGPPVITIQPVINPNDTVNDGSTVTFVVGAAGTPAITSYEWWKGDGTGGAIRVDSTTTNSHVINAVSLADAGTYFVVVRNSVGSVQSDVFTLTVNPVAPSIVTNIFDATINEMDSVTFSVVASGTSPLSYQWWKNGAPITGAVSDHLSLYNVGRADSGSSYSVVVTNSVTTINSAVAVLSVYRTIPDLTLPADGAAGQSVTPWLAWTPYTSGLFGYQVSTVIDFSSGIVADDSTALNFVQITTPPLTAGTVYYWRVRNALGYWSATFSFTTAALNAPVITTPPASQTVNVGDPVTFTVVATGTGTLHYDWQFNGVTLGAADADNLVIGTAALTDAGSYTVVVTDDNAIPTTSAAAVLMVNSAPTGPTITTDPASQTVNVGDPVTFTVVATGTGTLHYDWQFNGVTLGAADADNLVIGTAALTDAGSYTVVVTDDNAIPTTSAAAVLTVNSAPTGPTITTDPASQTVNVGDPVTFTVVATGTGTLHYDWQFNGVTLGAADADNLVIGTAALTDAGSYTVVVTDDNAIPTTSAAAVLTVN